MKKLLATIALAACACVADGKQTGAEGLSGATPEERAARHAEFVRTNGGMIKIGGEGKIAILHNLPPKDAMGLEAPVSLMRRILNVEIEVLKSDKKFSVPDAGRLVVESGGRAVVFIVDDEALPPTLVAPEGHWAVVNVRALWAGAEDAGRPQRLRVAFLRSMCRVLGSDTSKFKTSCLYPAGSAADLERLEGGFVTVDTMIAMMQYIEHIGLKPYRLKTYRDACEDGDAPTPTNDVQRAIWEQVKADRERGPTNAITIPPPAK